MVNPMDLDAFYEKYEESWADMVEEEWDDHEDDEQRKVALAQAAERAAERAKNPRPTTPPPPIPSSSSFRQEKPIELDSVSSWRRDDHAPPKLVAIDAMNNTPKVTAWTNTIERLSRHATPLSQQRIEKKTLPEQPEAKETNATSSWHAYSRVLQQEYKDERAAAQEDFLRRFRSEVKEEEQAMNDKQAKEISETPPDADAASHAGADLPVSHDTSLQETTTEAAKEDPERLESTDQGQHATSEAIPVHTSDGRPASREQKEEPDERVIAAVSPRDSQDEEGKSPELAASQAEPSPMSVQDGRQDNETSAEAVPAKEEGLQKESEASAQETPAVETPLAEASPEQPVPTPTSPPVQQNGTTVDSTSHPNPTNGESQVKPEELPVVESTIPAHDDETAHRNDRHTPTQSTVRHPSPTPRVEAIAQNDVTGTPVLKASLTDLLSDTGSPRLPPVPAGESPVLKASLSDLLSDSGPALPSTRARSPQRAPQPAPPASEQAGSVNKWAAFASAHKPARPEIDSGVHINSRSSSRSASHHATSRSPSREKTPPATTSLGSDTPANSIKNRPHSEFTSGHSGGWGAATAVGETASMPSVSAQPPTRPTAPATVDPNATQRWKQFASSHKPTPSHWDNTTITSKDEATPKLDAASHLASHNDSAQATKEETDQGWGSGPEPCQQQQGWGAPSEPVSSTDQGWGTTEASHPAQSNGWDSVGKGTGAPSEFSASTGGWGSNAPSQPAGQPDSNEEPVQQHGWGSLPAATAPIVKPKVKASVAVPTTTPKDDNDGRAAPAWRQKLPEAARYRSRT